MKLWKILGYCFSVLGALVFCYGFTVAFMDMLNPASIWSMASSGASVDFFSVFWSQIAGWTVLAVALLIVGGIGLFVGRGPKRDKRSNEQRIAELENSLTVISNRLEEIELKQNQTTP
jgi:hypothetical protein